MNTLFFNSVENGKTLALGVQSEYIAFLKHEVPPSLATSLPSLPPPEQEVGCE